MRILHVVPSYYPAVRYGGTIPAVHGLAQALAVRGHEVHVYTTNVDGPDDSDVPLGTPVGLDGVSVWYFPAGLGRRLFRSPELGRALASTMSQFDILHTHSVFLWPTTAAARAARARRIPYVLSPHGMLVADLFRRKSYLVKHAWLAAFERQNVKRAAAIHATSDIEADALKAMGLDYSKMIVIPNGVAPPNDILRLDAPARRTVLFLGRINWKKGLDRLIPAMRDVREAELIVAGNDEDGYRAQMELLAREIGISDRIRFLGAVNGEDKWRLLAEASVLALPSYSENFGIVVVESMAAGCPVVVTPEVGLAAVVREAGAGVVVDGSTDQLARALRSVLDNSAAAATMGEAGRRVAAERFRWNAIGIQMEQAYCKILRDGTPRSARRMKST